MADIWIIGDSTVEDNQPPFRGWGWALPEFVSPSVRVHNHALSGRSSRSFLNEGLFDPVREGMQNGDLLLIQFGHNDEKADAERHTDPTTSYQEFLGFYCDAALQKGTLPVLITPVSRRFFEDAHKMLYTHGEYPAAIRDLAKKRGLPLIDLKMRSRELFESLGDQETASLFVRLAPGENPDFPDGHDDKTHFNAFGAKRICELIVEGLRQDKRTSAFVRAR